MPDPTIYEIEEHLEQLGWEHGLDWAIKCDVARECMWAVELRITLKPNDPDGPDRSQVFYAAGASDPYDGIVRVYEAARAAFPEWDWTPASSRKDGRAC